ncbi:hypothetical protein BV25DRAFT_1835150 [Artomyces pyxidatus]|uniref:Uncharacterized protein n=1 Tax=Artomyces pyxidatus TaxID=48021 RepID=A0ACB8TGD1_9AGAM|nr:hypothetical protein BV25DRAFT_1835150 [Artomyces pyxidatus]
MSPLPGCRGLLRRMLSGVTGSQNTRCHSETSTARVNYGEAEGNIGSINIDGEQRIAMVAFESHWGGFRMEHWLRKSKLESATISGGPARAKLRQHRQTHRIPPKIRATTIAALPCLWPTLTVHMLYKPPWNTLPSRSWGTASLLRPAGRAEDVHGQKT